MAVSAGLQRFFDWMGRRIGAVAIGVAVLTVVALPLAMNKSDDEPSFDPAGEIYDTQALVDDRFALSSPVGTESLIVEARAGDALTRDVLLELKENSDRLRDDPPGERAHLATDFASDLEVEVAGVWTIADEVDAALSGGLEGATDRDVKGVVAEILGADGATSPLRRTLSQRATTESGAAGSEPAVIWQAPALAGRIAFDRTSFPPPEDETFAGTVPEAQEWLREVQDVLRGEQRTYRLYGVAIDADLEFEEQAAAAAPFILLAIVGILLLVGALLRSYWAAVLVALGLGITVIWVQAITTVLGFKGGMLLGFIVPIATISFGVDFFIHASGRAREEQVAGASRERAYPLGLGAVFPALALAASSSVAAFLSNAVSGIEAIVQFGIGASISLVVAFALLSIVAPKLLLVIEDHLGEAPLDRGRMIPYKLGFVVMAVVAGAAVTMAVVMPAVGGAALVLFGLLFLAVPYWLTRRLYRRAAARGVPVGTRIKGAGHSLRSAGDIVHFLARWRVFTIPATVVLAVAGAVGFTQVESRFEFSDFFSTRSDFIQSVDLLDEHFGETTGGGEGLIYVEGDLTQPAVLTELDATVAALDAADDAAARDFLSRDLDGDLVVGDSALTVARAAVASPAARQAIEQASTVTISDDDGDGLPDSSDQVEAAYAYALAEGVPGETGGLVLRPEAVTELVWTDGGGTWATPLRFTIPTLTEDQIILDARRALEGAAAQLRAGPAGEALAVVSASGETVVGQDSLDAFTDAMLVALPVALVLCAALAALFMRSLKYGLASVVPIVLVVGWVYGFMYLAGYTINVVTATIAAIAVGVGIDYSTHFTMRFREEFRGEPSRFPALRRAGEGTGGALAVSALSSIIGFGIMGLAPMPIFSTFGVLTAVMIFFSLLVALLVLPSLLLVITRSRSGAERERLERDITRGEYEYDPHRRDPRPPPSTVPG